LLSPIGIFDSGIGGLTVAAAIAKALPNQPLIYFGDTAHLPYGDKSPSLVIKYALQITDFLIDQGVKAVVIACNTASAVAAEAVTERCRQAHVMCFEVIAPAVRAALAQSSLRRIGVISTKTTFQSHIYLRTLLAADPTVLVVEKATPLLVPMIEEGWVSDAIMPQIIEAYLSDTGFLHIDALILGCTHYPLIHRQVEAYFRDHRPNPPIQIIDSSKALAAEVAAALKDTLFPEQISYQFFVSDLTPYFADSAVLFFGSNITLQQVCL
jgi:glutamate racemase